MKRIMSLIVVCIIFFCSCSKVSEPVIYSGFYFDTFITVSIYDDVSTDVLNGLEALCEHYDQLFSQDNPLSDIYKINNGSGEYVEVSEETVALIREALVFSEATSGRVDPTIEGVLQYWTFDGISESLPDSNQILTAVNDVNYKNIEISGNKVRIDANQRISLGFIGKGYIADSLGEYLKSNNINNAVINLGGNVLCIGHKADGSQYNVAIKKPFSEEVIYVANIDDGSVVTSGVYERYFYNSGELFHHILDTQTGYPVHQYKDGNEIYSVTIIGPSSLVCDALSTTLFILGVDEGIDFINTYYSEYRAIYIDSENNLYFSRT